MRGGGDPILDGLEYYSHGVNPVVFESLRKLNVSQDRIFHKGVDLLSAKSEYTKRTGIEVLTHIKDQRAIPFLAELLKNTDVRLSATEAILSIGGYKYESVLRDLLNRKPSSAKGDLVLYLDEAIKYRSEGYDFKVIYTPEETHTEAVNGPYGEFWYDQDVVDSPEILKIERGDKLSDRAMQTTPEIARNTKDLGGIALDAKMLDLQIKRDGNGVPLPISQQPLDKINIQGFVPQIISIQPVNLPAFLGLNPQKEEESLAKV